MLDQFKEIAPGVYEGMSPAKKEVRRFIKLPSGLTEDEMIAVTEAALGEKTSGQGWRDTIHLSHDITEKNEVIGGETYVRFLANADIGILQERAKAVEECLNELRSEKSGEIKK